MTCRAVCVIGGVEVRCARPAGHDGPHMTRSGSAGWSQEERVECPGQQALPLGAEP